MRVETSITSVSWIPSEAIRGVTRLPFDLEFTHYDPPPPDHLDDLDDLHARGAFRFANQLRAWADIEDGRIVGVGQDGRTLISKTLVRLGPAHLAFKPTGFPVLRPDPDWGASSARFEQTAGGRPGVPAPRRVRGHPFVQVEGPNVWTTLALTISGDGTTSWELAGASSFPRHWLYDDRGDLVAKAGTIDFDEWYATAFDHHSPWGGENREAVVAAAESELERALSVDVMRGGRRPRIRDLDEGELLVRQGDEGTDVFLVLDGVLSVDVDGREVAQLGPGSIVGERALLEDGRRTSTLRAVTRTKVAQAAEGDLQPEVLRELAEGHRREDQPT